MPNQEAKLLIGALGKIVEQMTAYPHTVIGSQNIVRVDSNTSGGTIVGENVSVVVGAGSGGGTVIGKSVTVSLTGPSPVEKQIVEELRAAMASIASEASPPKSWLLGLLKRVSDLGNRALDAAVTAATAAAAKFFLGA
jgi:hypothetical protein